MQVRVGKRRGRGEAWGLELRERGLADGGTKARRPIPSGFLPSFLPSLFPPFFPSFRTCPVSLCPTLSYCALYSPVLSYPVLSYPVLSIAPALSCALNTRSCPIPSPRAVLYTSTVHTHAYLLSPIQWCPPGRFLHNPPTLAHPLFLPYLLSFET